MITRIVVSVALPDDYFWQSPLGCSIIQSSLGEVPVYSELSAIYRSNTFKYINADNIVSLNAQISKALVYFVVYLIIWFYHKSSKCITCTDRTWNMVFVSQARSKTGAAVDYFLNTVWNRTELLAPLLVLSRRCLCPIPRDFSAPSLGARLSYPCMFAQHAASYIFPHNSDFNASPLYSY